MSDDFPRHRQAGDHFKAGGVECRVRRGHKTPISGDGQDLVFQFRTPGGVWQQPGHEFVVALTHFMYENEEDLYPSAAGWRGGRKILDSIEEAIGVGYPAAVKRLERELRGAREGIFE